YDNHKIANYELNEPYVRLTIPIPALWNEETENEFTIINTGDYKFGIDYVQIRGWDFKDLRKATLALKDAELYPRNVANCFNASYATPANRAEALGFLKKNSSIGKLPFLIFNDAKAFEKMFPDSENMTKGFIPLFRSFETAVKPFDDFREREYLFFGNYRV
ncbi:MAG: hypothetical protein GXP32_00155, partial [Kiritimatiellaeota bacterium]|nr:hypothetical protein [Kiritimatiellota bacterium]